MSKTIHKLGGLPRAGSTILMNILAQNPQARPEMEPSRPKWPDVLGKIGKQYSHIAKFWEELCHIA